MANRVGSPRLLLIRLMMASESSERVVSAAGGNFRVATVDNLQRELYLESHKQNFQVE